MYSEHILEKHETVTDNPLIMIYVNKIKNRTAFKIKTGYYLELLMPEIMKLLGSTKSKTTNNKNGENSAHLWVGGCVGCGRTTLPPPPLQVLSALFGILNVLFCALFHFKIITLLKVFYNFTK